jgi:4-amino-4-deoxy-L-arabinose transferase-like glycosyltransferase
VGDKLYRETVLGSERKDLALVLGLALGFRMLLYKLTYVISIDGAAVYFPMAEHFASGRWLQGLAVGYHPMYPLLGALFSKVLGDLQFSGQMVSVLFGTLTVIPIFYLAKGMSNRRVGFFSALFLAILPYHVELSADFLTDTTYAFFLVLAIWLGWKALETEDWKMFLLAGFATGLAYLDRAEGIGVLLPLALWIFFRKHEAREKKGCPKGLAIIILLLSFLFVASPYILYLRSYTGTWTISRKPAVNKVVVLIKEKIFFQKQEKKEVEKFDHFIQRLQQKEDGTSSGLARWLKRIGSFFEFLVETCHPILFFFFIVGLIKRRGLPSWRGEGFLLSTLVVYALLLFWLAISSYISHRYFVPFAVLCLVWSGRGFMESHLWLREKISSKRWEKVRFLEANGLLCLALITVIAILPSTMHSSRKGKIVRKEAGLWIKHNSTSKPPIYTDLVQVNHYAGGQWIPLREVGLSYDELVSRAGKAGADFLVLSEGNIERICPGFFAMQRQEDLKEVLRVSRDKETIIVYDVRKR